MSIPPRGNATDQGGRVYAYLRNSTRDQKLSPEAQRKAILKAFPRVDRWFHDDGLSGSTELDKRPALAALLSTLRRGDTIVVAKRDRLARDNFLSAWLEKESRVRKFRIESADGTGNGDSAEGRLMASIVAAFASYELEVIRARTRAALQAKRRKGERVGSVPYGFRLKSDGKSLAPVEAQQRQIRRMVRMRKRGKSLRAIAECLNSAGVKPARAERWNPMSVRKIVARAQDPEAYAGVRR